MHTEKNRFSIRRSRPGLGLGLFALVSIKKGDFLLEYTGRRIPTSYADTLKTRYLFEIDQEWTVDGSDTSNTARYINHSCRPNSECELENGRVFFYAIRDIQDGEEITIDYGDEYFDEFIRPRGCKCQKCTRGKSVVYSDFC